MLITMLETDRTSPDGLTTHVYNKDETYDIPDTAARTLIAKGVAFEPRARADGFKANQYMGSSWLEVYAENARGWLTMFDFIQCSAISDKAKDEVTELMLTEILNPRIEQRKTA